MQASWLQPPPSGKICGPIASYLPCWMWKTQTMRTTQSMTLEQVYALHAPGFANPLIYLLPDAVVFQPSLWHYMFIWVSVLLQSICETPKCTQILLMAIDYRRLQSRVWDWNETACSSECLCHSKIHFCSKLRTAIIELLFKDCITAVPLCLAVLWITWESCLPCWKHLQGWIIRCKAKAQSGKARRWLGMLCSDNFWTLITYTRKIETWLHHGCDPRCHIVKSATAFRQLTSVHIHNSIAIEQYVDAGDYDGVHRPDDDHPSLLDICLLNVSLQG